MFGLYGRAGIKGISDGHNKKAFQKGHYLNGLNIMTICPYPWQMNLIEISSQMKILLDRQNDADNFRSRFREKLENLRKI